MLSAVEAKQYADSYYTNLDILKKLENLIRMNSSNGEYQLCYHIPELVNEYGTNTLSNDHSRILFELKKAKYDIKFDQENLVIIWG